MKVSLLVISILVSTCIRAQKIISLKEVLNRVEENYPLLKSKQALVNQMTNYVRASKKDYLPDLIVGDQYQFSTNNGLTGSYYNNEGSTISTSGGIRTDNIYQGVFGSFSTFTVDWHIFNFGKVRQSVQFAEAQVRVSEADYENERFKQKIIAADAYLQLSFLQKVQEAQQKNLERAVAFQQYAISRARAGLLPGADSSYANAEVAKAKLLLIQNSADISSQKNLLASLSGFKTDSIVIDTTVLFHKIPVIAIDSLSVQLHPYIGYANQRVKLAQENSLLLKKSVLPTINILGMGWARGSGVDNGNNSYSSKFSDGMAYQTYNYMVAVALKWNIMSLAKNKEEYKAAINQVESLKFKVDEQTLILQSQLANAASAYKVAVEQTRLAPVQYQSAYDSYQQSEARYKAGLTTLTELIQALYNLNRADVDRAVANNNIWKSLLENAAATGDLNIFLNQLP